MGLKKRIDGFKNLAENKKIQKLSEEMFGYLQMLIRFAEDLNILTRE